MSWLTAPDKWDTRFIRLADEARRWTKGQDRGVGACLVHPDRRRLSLGYSGLPRGLVDDAAALSDASYKDGLLVHAELNAILNAACSVEGWTLYSTAHPCSNCASAIVQAGVARVVCAAPLRDSRWTVSQLRGLDAMVSVGVAVDHLDEDTMRSALSDKEYIR